MPTEYNKGYREGMIEGLKQSQDKHDRMVSRLVHTVIALATVLILFGGIMVTVLLLEIY